VLDAILPSQASEVAEVLAVDLNGDGLRDVVVQPTNVSLGDVVVSAAPVFLLNRGGGNFTDATQQLFGGPAPAVEWGRELLTADFNRDGRPDILIADHGHVNDSDPNQVRAGAQQHLILSTSDGHFVDASKNLPQQLSFTHSAAVADVNGDGAPDIFENNLGCCSPGHVQDQLLLNDGTGHFTVAPGAISGEVTDAYGNDHSYACLFADVNDDGAPDLVIGGAEEKGSNASRVLLNDGHGHFTYFETLPPTIGPPDNAFVIDMKSADVNGDGSPDLIFAETRNDPWYQSASIQILINGGHGHFTDETATRMPEQPKTDNYPQRILVDDVNDDGRPDLTVHFTTGNVPQTTPTALYLNEDGVFQQVDAPKDGFGEEGGGGIGYVNGDGAHALFSVEWRPLGSPSHYYVTPQIVPPSAPARVRAVRLRGGVRVIWPPAAQASRYQLRRNGTLVATTTTTTYLDRRPGRHPSYTVRSVNAAGTSPFSEAAKAG
jgi:hypothetical protein